MPGFDLSALAEAATQMGMAEVHAGSRYGAVIGSLVQPFSARYGLCHDRAFMLQKSGCGDIRMLRTRAPFDIEISLPRLDDKYVLHIVLGGEITVGHGSGRRTVRGDELFLATPGMLVDLLLPGGLDMMIVQLPRAAVMRHWPGRSPLPGHDLGRIAPIQPRSAGLLSLVAHLCWDTTARQGSANPRAHYDSQLLNMLAIQLAHAFTPETGRADAMQPSQPYITLVQSTCRFLETLADQPTGAIPAAARALDVSTRTLERAFRQVLGQTPQDWLLQHRLDGARSSLLDAELEGATVTEVALRWGFHDASRFAARYAAAYGERPSDTLRRARLSN